MTTGIEAGDFQALSTKIHKPTGLRTSELDRQGNSASMLCEQCRSLDLRPERFVVNDRSTLPSDARLRSPGGLHDNGVSLSTWPDSRVLGTFTEVLKKSIASPPCPLCSLVVGSLVETRQRLIEQADEGDDTLCYLTWEIDGRQVIQQSETSARKGPRRTRRLHISWSNDQFEDSYLVFVAPQTHLVPNSDAQQLTNYDALFLGRELQRNISKQALVKSWLDLCCKSHGEPCGNRNDTSQEFEEMVSQSYFGVVDVIDLRLASLPFDDTLPKAPERVDERSSSRFSPGGARTSPHNHTRQRAPYVALSYVWGQGERPHTTDRKNVMHSRRHGGLESFLSKLPNALQDAISLVRGLGIRYLWIDSLCIVQDSNRSWNLNSRAMDLIYGNSILTIIAADGSNASAGLKAMHVSSQLPLQSKQDCAPGVRLMVSRSLETSIKRSVWNQRAWTFQERLMSRRCLIFTGGRVYFQCLSTGMSEDIHADREGIGWSLDLVRAPLQMLRELDTRPFWVYMVCIALYTARRLTKSEDVLAAFGGLSNYLVKAMQAPLIFGLPTSHFDLAMLWAPSSTLHPLKSTQPRSNAPPAEFPSWSWCGWTGGKSSYKPELVQDCVVNLHEWLVDHTWICWYIRDGHGRLRPVWNARKAPYHQQRRTTDQRWLGYPAVDSPRSEHVDITIRRKESIDRSRDGDRDPRINWSRVRHADKPPNPARDYNERVIGYARPRHRSLSPREEMRDYQQQRIYPRSREHEWRNNAKRMQPNAAERSYEQEDYRYGEKEEISIRPPGYSEYPRSHADFLQDPYLSEDDDSSDADHAQIPEDYGRSLSADLRQKNQKSFKLTLPENPYRVVMAEYTPNPSKEFPDQPFLQFWTWYCTFDLFKRNSGSAIPDTGLNRYDIADDYGDWCGTIELPDDWTANSDTNSSSADKVDSKHSFIALSDAKAFTAAECEVWTYYIPKEREQSEWDLYNVMLIEQKGYLWQRVAIGKVFKAGFMSKEWKEIVLG